jgi:hypothetical protein
MAIIAADPASKVAQTFTDGSDAEKAILVYGYIPLLADGSPAHVYKFEGGVLVEGAPLNVWTNGVWYTGQQEILAPYWKSGEIHIPPDSLLALPTVDAPGEVVQAYATYKGVPQATTIKEAYAAGPAGGISPMTWLLIAAGAFLLLRR